MLDQLQSSKPDRISPDDSRQEYSRRDFLRFALGGVAGAEATAIFPSWFRRLFTPKNTRLPVEPTEVPNPENTPAFRRNLREALGEFETGISLYSQLQKIHAFTSKSMDISFPHGLLWQISQQNKSKPEDLSIRFWENKIAPDSTAREFINGPTQTSRSFLASENLQITTEQKVVPLDARQFVEALFQAIVLADRNRVTQINLNEKMSGVKTLESIVNTPLGYSIDFDNIEKFFHEIIHITHPGHPILFQLDDGTWIVGHNAVQSIKSCNQWMDLLAKHGDFFEKYFFSVEGDALHTFLGEGRIDLVTMELVAISCTDFLFQETRNWPGADGLKDYPDIELAIRQQLARTVYGIDSDIDWPHGLDDASIQTLRSRIGSAYLQFYINQLPNEIKTGVISSMKQNMQRFYCTDGADSALSFAADLGANNQTLYLQIVQSKCIDMLIKISEIIYKQGSFFWSDGTIVLN